MTPLYAAIPADCLPAIREALAGHLIECQREFDFIVGKAKEEPTSELYQQQEKISARRLARARVALDECIDPKPAAIPPF